MAAPRPRLRPTFFRRSTLSQPDGASGRLAGQAKLDFAQVFAAAIYGRKVARATLDHCIHVWSVLSVALIHAYDPEVLVVGGAVARRAAGLPAQHAGLRRETRVDTAAHGAAAPGSLGKIRPLYLEASRCSGRINEGAVLLEKCPYVQVSSVDRDCDLGWAQILEVIGPGS